LTQRLPVKAPLWLLALITISGTLAMHMFVPALPAAAMSLGASTAAMQATISVYILGLAGGQLIYGPLSDGLGRRPVLLTGLFVYAIAGVAAALAPDVDALVAARLFQALGGCAGLALGRAIVRDTSRPDEAVRDLALLNLMIMIGPGLAPMLGSALTGAFGWRAIFLMLATLGGVTLLLAWRLLPETRRATGSIKVAALMRDYMLLLRSPSFMGFALGGGCATTSIYAFIAAAPFIISSQLHRSVHEVGLYLGLVMVGMAMGNAITRHLSRRVRTERLLIAANLVGMVSAIAFLVIVQLEAMTVWDVVGLMFLFALGAGATSPAALSKALSVAPVAVIGSAAGLYGFLQMAVGATCTFALGIASDPAWAAACVLTAAMVVSQSAIWLALRQRAAA
jgi:DHA1 family bicyclomycin/chloramphenicol resistance-like MFS transporter